MWAVESTFVQRRLRPRICSAHFCKANSQLIDCCSFANVRELLDVGRILSINGNKPSKHWLRLCTCSKKDQITLHTIKTIHPISHQFILLTAMAPIFLPANQPSARPFKGGPQISAFRNSATISGPYEPEDWIASTTCCRGCAESRLGMTVLPDGRLLADVIARQPEYWLGDEHLKHFGVDTKLLVKLLDAGQRLPVHAHPHRDWAQKHVGAAHGKAEAWFILTAGEVHLGLKEDISQAELLDLVERQDTDGLLDRMHRLDVKAFDTVYVPPGCLHSTGKGILLIEVQEPEDMNVLCEWKDCQVNGFKDGHLGLGFPTALTAVNTKGCTDDDIRALITANDTYGSVVVDQAKEYFDLERIKVNEGETCRQGFTILLVCEGDFLYSTEGVVANLVKGNTMVIPHGDGDFTLRGRGEVVAIRPPSC